MPGDDDGLAALDLIEQSGKMRLGFGGLDFSRHRLSTSRCDWSKIDYPPVDVTGLKVVSACENVNRWP
jgi:hypothetical protein